MTTFCIITPKNHLFENSDSCSIVHIIEVVNPYVIFLIQIIRAVNEGSIQFEFALRNVVEKLYMYFFQQIVRLPTHIFF